MYSCDRAAPFWFSSEKCGPRRVVQFNSLAIMQKTQQAGTELVLEPINCGTMLTFLSTNTDSSGTVTGMAAMKKHCELIVHVFWVLQWWTKMMKPQLRNTSGPCSVCVSFTGSHWLSYQMMVAAGAAGRPHECRQAQRKCQRQGRLRAQKSQILA